MQPNTSPELRRSQWRTQWAQALKTGDSELLGRLSAQDDPAPALLEIETFINGIYFGSRHPLSLDKAEIEAKVCRVVPFMQDIRDRWGWHAREFDLNLLQLIRRSGLLSPVLGAGVSVPCGAPSWPKLVQLLLEETLEKGVDVVEFSAAAGNPEGSPFEFPPKDSVRAGGGPWRYQRRVREVKRYAPDQDALARRLLAEVRAKGSAVDFETLKQGAQICHDLCGRDHLFRLVTRMIYTRASGPSETHRAIARLGHPVSVPVRGAGTFPGWDSIITYNYDSFMSEALAEEKVPHAAWAMKNDEMAGDPDVLAKSGDWHVPVYHLHGYSPRRLFLTSGLNYVFSDLQYQAAYAGPPSKILTTVLDGHLGNPVHIALYVGCSFSDEAMNGLLSTAIRRYPGRYHYALLKWPHPRNGQEPTPGQVKAESAKYLEIGIRPIWFDDFPELPGLISRLE